MPGRTGSLFVALVGALAVAAAPAHARPDRPAHRHHVTAHRAVAPQLADEFNGPAGAPPDPWGWTPEVGGGGWGNDELQTYTDRPANASLDGRGHLAIVARREPAVGPDGIPRAFTSTRLTTATKVEFRYGRLEARVRVPAGRGLLSQVWALGADVWERGWPQSGEIDLMEVLGERPTRVVGSLHGPSRDGSAWALNTEGSSGVSLAAGFHTYRMRWSPGRITMALDGRTYAIYTRSRLPGGARWAFDKPFFLVLDVAVGGRWPGAPDATTPFPATMLVDWIRLYDARTRGSDRRPGGRR